MADRIIEPSAEMRVVSAIAALEQSREAMVTVVSPKKKTRPRDASSSSPPSPRQPRAPSSLLALSAAVSAVARGWWRHHPLRATVEEVESTGNALIGPQVRRHPALALAGAAGLGAALVMVFPRRGWAIALPWLGIEARGLVRSLWRTWHGRAPVPERY
jgi:hypothetical protein